MTNQIGLGMKLTKWVSGLFLVAALAACGGGGGSPALPTAGPTPNPGGGDGGVTAAVPTAKIEIINGVGVSTNKISAVEIAQIKATYKDAAGQPVEGVLVTFAETGGALLSFAPASKTALTDSAGVAFVEARAASTSGVGATEVGASATISGVATAVSKAFAITSAPGGSGESPQVLAAALTFLDVNPEDKSIVLAGSGGNGRSETAILRFRVVDKNSSPVKGAVIDFSVTPPDDVTLNISGGISDAEGVVVTSVSSKTEPTAVVVTATVHGKPVSSQSDQLLVTTGVATQEGFDLSATKFGLNANKTGDSSTLIVSIVDTNGNPVADGVPVVFTATHGAVGSSSRGGCVTVNGSCSVEYRVQDPRPADGEEATITASTRVGNGDTISDTIALNIVQFLRLNLYETINSATPLTMLAAPDQCDQAKSYPAVFVGTPAGLGAPGDTTVAATALSSEWSVTIKDGAPIKDQLAVPSVRTPLVLELKAKCPTDPATPIPAGDIKIKFTNAGQDREVLLQVPAPPPPGP